MDTSTFVSNLHEILGSLLVSDTELTTSPKMATGNDVTTISFADGGKLILITSTPTGQARQHTGQSSFTGC